MTYDGFIFNVVTRAGVSAKLTVDNVELITKGTAIKSWRDACTLTALRLISYSLTAL